MEPLFLAVGDKEISTSKRMHLISSKIKTFQALRDRMMIYFYGFIFLKIGGISATGIADFLQRNSQVVLGAVINTSLRASAARCCV